MRRFFNECTRRYLVYCLVLLCLFNAIYFYHKMNSACYNMPQESTLNYDVVKSDISCYDSVEDDVLPSIDDLSIKPEDKQIFFHETSCRGGLTSRQACAVESVARLHPQRQINILFTSPVSGDMLTKSTMAKLLKFRNVRVARIQIKKYSKGSLAETLLTERIVESAHWMEYASEILRFLTLNKYGGVCLDTDAIVVRSFDTLPNDWVATENVGYIATGAIGFSKSEVGANITKAILMYLRDNFDPKSWTGNGASAIQAILDPICPGAIESYGICHGVEILPPQYFYPINYNDHHVYFKNGTIYNMEGPYMHHTWNFLSQDLHIESDSPYAKLAKKSCPTVFNIYSKYWDRPLVNGKFKI